MSLLLIGVLLWAAIHFFPALAPDARRRLVARLGEYGYKGVFTLAMLGAIALMIRGWKIAPVELLYVPPAWGRHATALLVLATFLSFFAPYLENNVRRLTRHPQLLGITAWGIGHLLSSGEIRSVVFFGGLAAWAVVEIVLINRRDGAWQKPARAPLMGDFRLLLTGLGFFIVVLYTHVWLFGVSPLPA